MHATQPQCPRQLGFTLLEVVISVLLLCVLSVVGGSMIAGSFYATRAIGSEHLANSTARYAMERMVREIREISYDINTTALGITAMSAAQLSFTKSGLSGSSTAVSFSHTSPTLSMSVAGSSATLASNITALAFTYLDASGTVTATPSAVRLVRISLTATPPQAQAITLTTQVRLRNP